MIVVFLLKKPSHLSTTAECLDTGVGALNIEDSCVALAGEDPTKRQNQQKMEGAIDFGVASGLVGSSIMTYKKEGRWPANVLICNDACSEGMDEQSGVRPTGAWCRHKGKAHHFGGARGEEYDNWKTLKEPPSGASRYFKKVSR